MVKKIGLLGGTFNPIHIGHLILAEFVRDRCSLDRIIFIPTGPSPHKDSRDIVSDYHRLNMVKLAIATNEFFDYSDYEIKKDTTSYSIDTINYFNSIYPEDELYFIIGGDSLINLKTWKDYDQIIRSIKIVVVDRLGYEQDILKKEINDLNRTYKGKIGTIDFPIIEISSTRIREKISKKESIKYLVGEGVEDYIYKNNLYK